MRTPGFVAELSLAPLRSQNRGVRMERANPSPLVVPQCIWWPCGSCGYGGGGGTMYCSSDPQCATFCGPAAPT